MGVADKILEAPGKKATQVDEKAGEKAVQKAAEIVARVKERGFLIKEDFVPPSEPVFYEPSPKLQSALRDEVEKKLETRAKYLPGEFAEKIRTGYLAKEEKPGVSDEEAKRIAAAARAPFYPDVMAAATGRVRTKVFAGDAGERIKAAIKAEQEAEAKRSRDEEERIRTIDASIDEREKSLKTDSMEQQSERGDGRKKYVLTVDESPSGAGQVNLHGKYTTPSDIKVTIRQRPMPGNKFDHWVINGYALRPGDYLPVGIHPKIRGVSVTNRSIPPVYAIDGSSVVEITMDQNYDILVVYRKEGEERTVGIETPERKTRLLTAKEIAMQGIDREKTHPPSGDRILTGFGGGGRGGGPGAGGGGGGDGGGSTAPSAEILRFDPDKTVAKIDEEIKFTIEVRNSGADGDIYVELLDGNDERKVIKQFLLTNGETREIAVSLKKDVDPFVVKCEAGYDRP